LLLVVLLVASACGSRLSTEEIQAAGTAGAGDATGVGPRDTTTGDTGTGPASADGAATDAGPAAGATPGAAGGGGAAAGGGQAAATGGKKSPIVIGVVGSFSGIAGPPSRPVADAWVAWSKSVNAKGGINGHPVQLLIGDDGTNASRTVSIAQDFVENKGAVALSFHGPDPSGFAKYAQSKSVPVIGTTVGTQLWNQNPMLFPSTAGIDGVSWGKVRGAKDAGASKVAIVYCAESPVCKAGADGAAAAAGGVGVDVVYKGQISLGAPDFTAECLQMRNSGAQAVLLNTENGSAMRLAGSCSRQGYKPIWVTSAADDRMAKSPDFENAVAVNGAFSWFLRGGSPAIDEYVGAIRKYVPSRLEDGNSLQAAAWQSAKVFERAAAKVGDKPTSAEILEGLHAMRGDDIGGLVSGGMLRTFTRNRPTPDTVCMYVGRVKGGKWTGALAPQCR
jgi:branched-chain amino acid transport system substrate-binding protein